MNSSLPERIKQLQNDREKHAQAIKAIDQTLQGVIDAIGSFRECINAEEGIENFPIETDIPQPSAIRRKGKFAQTAEVTVLEFISRNVAPTTAEINAHWRGQARCGTANVTLFKLLRQGMIQRVSDPAVRGSRYVAMPGAAIAKPRELGTGLLSSIELSDPVVSYQ